MYSLGLVDEDAKNHLGRQIATIDVIIKLSEQVAAPPEPGSELASLNALAPNAPIPLAQSVKAGLDTAKDCLTHVQAIFVDGDKFALVGVQSLMRAALLGAARAAFVLGRPQRSPRRCGVWFVLPALVIKADDVEW